MRDIVLPKGNEQELAEMALRLGHERITFAYPYAIFPKTMMKGKIGMPFDFAAIAANQKEIIACRSKGILSLYRAHEDVREAIEGLRPGIIFGIEYSERKDFIHHRNSGLNHIMAKAAKDKKVTIGISFSELLILNASTQAVVLGRIRQNISLLRKYGASIRLFSLADDPYSMRPAHDLISFLIGLGMTRDEAERALG